MDAMAGELYSRPLSGEARSKLVHFMEAYLSTLWAERADDAAVIAKARAIETLHTDIDILVFANTISIIHTPAVATLLTRVREARTPLRELATILVDISEKAHQADKRTRMADRQ